MARKKVNHTYISNPAKRKAAFKKRKKGLVKKISEITTLCGIEACAIIYSPEEHEPEVWPSDRGVQSVISRFKGVSELEQSKKMLCQESLLRKNLIKAQRQLMKLRNENRKKEMSLLMCQYFTGGYNLENANIIDLNDITFLTDQKLEEIRKQIEMRQAQEVTPEIENGGETMTQGEKALLNCHVQGPETNVDAMQNLNWSMDNINGGGGDGMLTLEDVDVQSGWLNQYIL